jgi:hypothetical protein
MLDLNNEIRRLIEPEIRPVTFEEISLPRSKPESLAARRPLVFGAGILAIGIATILVVIAVFISGSTDNSPSAAAATVLHEAAGNTDAADSPAPGSGQDLVLSETFELHGYLEGSDGSLLHYNVPGYGMWRIGQSGAGSETITLGTVTFPSAIDQATWKSLGSPVLVPDTHFDEAFPLSPAIAQEHAAENGLGAFPAAPTVLPLSSVSSLSTDPEVLEHELMTQYEGGILDVGRTFDLAATLLEEGGTAAQRSALYEMISSLPGVTSDGPTNTDVTNLPGVAVSVDVGGLRHELIFDPSNSKVLEERMIPDEPWPSPLPSLQGASAVADQRLAYTVWVTESLSPAAVTPTSP